MDIAEKIVFELECVSREIEDAKEWVKRAAQNIKRRAEYGVDEASNLVDGKRASLSWVEALASDAQEVQRAENHYNTLIQKQKMLASWLITIQDSE